MKELIALAKDCFESGDYLNYLKERTSAVPAKSVKYSPGEVVLNTDCAKRQGPCIFISSIRWKTRMYQSYGGYLVLWPSGRISTTTGIAKLPACWGAPGIQIVNLGSQIVVRQLDSNSDIGTQI